MTPRIAAPWVGTVEADGFVLDTPLVGEFAARERALRLWQVGSQVRRLPDGRWLVLLPASVSVRCEQAPGLPLKRTGSAWTVAGASQPAPLDGWLRLPCAGADRDWRLAALPVVHASSWIDLARISRRVLVPVLGVEPTVDPVAYLPEAQVDLRSAAKIPAASPRGARGSQALLEAARSVRSSAGSRTPGPGREPSAIRRAVGRLLMRSPAVPLARGRHAAYLRQLTDAFERRDYDNALRDAIGLDSGGMGFATLRLPRRRGDLRWSRYATAGGATVPYGPSVADVLRQLYRDAAEDLERRGRIDEAAFVLVELLAHIQAAVMLLERHGRLLAAAELAEARQLPAEQVVRLYWLAGDRARAMALARARGAYAAAIDRLQGGHSEQARELRAAWVADLRRAGRYRAAVEAAWHDPALRAHALPDIQAGMALGGPDAAVLLARLLALRPSPAARDMALALLGTEDPEITTARNEFVATLAQLPAADPAADRRLASGACRLLSDADALPPWGEKALREHRQALAERADPVLRADLLALSWVQSHRAAQRQLDVSGPTSAGWVPITDAVALGNGTILVACGDAGVRLLGRRGQVRARWDAPTHRLVVADGGGSAVLGRFDGHGTWELRRLELTTRRVSPWLVTRCAQLPGSFDGLVLHLVDPQRQLVVVDAAADRLQVLARLSADAQVIDFMRAPHQLSAVVHVPAWPGAEPRLERWTWELPSGTLRRRSGLPDRLQAAAITAHGWLLGSVEGTDGWHPAILPADAPAPQHPGIPEGADAVWLADGTAYALVVSSAGETQVRTTYGKHPALVRWTPDAPPHLRSHGNLITIWDEEGRIVVIEPATAQVQASCVTSR